MEKIDWIKELVQAEQKMEESGVIDVSSGFDPDRHLFTETIHFLQDLKTSFVEVATTFNQLKGTQLGRVKIYSISNTHANFMLFRNGFKLIFSFKDPGVIGLQFLYAGAHFATAASSEETKQEENILTARWGPFGDLIWTFQDQPIKIDYLVRYYLSRFIKESAK